MKKRKYTYYVADFETTVYEQQQETEVWASAIVKIGSEDVKIQTSIDDFFKYLYTLKGNIVVYFHNLKFDGSFILNYLNGCGYSQAYTDILDLDTCKRIKDKEMREKTFNYIISDKNIWYSITLKQNNRIIEFRDSLKLLPFSVDKICKDFETKHKKTSIEYEGERFAGSIISDKEKEYIKNDVLVIKEALEFFFTENEEKLTIGSCCLSEYRKSFHYLKYKELFPDLTKNKIDTGQTEDEFVRKSYKGAWCHTNKKFKGKIIANIFVYDSNSLYSYVMHSSSGNRYPVGQGFYCKSLPEYAKSKYYYYFIHFKCTFKIKDGFLPFIQIKDNLNYNSREHLETSDIYFNGKYYNNHLNLDGDIEKTIVEFTMTETDYKLFNDFYDVENLEIIDYIVYKTKVGIFDNYIDYYYEKKRTSSGAKRQLAKLKLNNLYGKMATGTNSSFRICQTIDGINKFYTVTRTGEKMPGYIPIGSAITSYARDYTIRSAQINKENFIYADTDSLHVIGKVKGIQVHDSDLGAWKCEGHFERGKYLRAKTYVDYGEGKYKITCAGMGKRCKELLQKSFGMDIDIEDIKEYEKEFIEKKRTLDDFKVGLQVPSKLQMHNIKGGIVLTPTTFEIKDI